MKKILLTFLVALFFTGAYAQMGAGIKAGVNFANQDIENFETESKTGYHFGAFLEFNTSGNFSIQPELLFSSQGSRITLQNVKEQWNFSYLTVPVMLKLKFLQVLHLHAGPQIGILFNAENDAGDDINELYKSADFALAFGGGFEMRNGFLAGARYVHGLSDINDNNPTFQDMKISNNTMQIYIGLSLF